MKIKTIKRYSFEHKLLNFSESTDHEHEFLSLVSCYNEKGNLIEEQKLNTENEADELNYFTYGTEGKLLEHKMNFIAEGFEETYRYVRDENGRLVKEEKLYGDDPGEATVYIYNDKGEVIEIIKTDADGEPESKETIAYNEKGNITTRKMHDASGNLTEKTELTYDEKENPILKSEYDGKGELASVSNFTYNEKNQLVGAVQKNTQGKLMESVTYVYDEHGNTIEKNIRDFHPRKLIYSFDENNNCIEEAVFDLHGNLSSKSIYEYNEHGNVVSELNYNMDTNRMNRDNNSGHRFEYEFFPE